MFMIGKVVALLFAFLTCVPLADAAADEAFFESVASMGFASTVCDAEPFEAFLEKHCVRCHGPEKEKGDLRIDQLSRDFKAGADSHHWAEALEKVNSGEMPPDKEPQPTQAEIAAFVLNLDSLIKEGRSAPASKESVAASTEDGLLQAVIEAEEAVKRAEESLTKLRESAARLREILLQRSSNP